jgi:hypothetical protein
MSTANWKKEKVTGSGLSMRVYRTRHKKELQTYMKKWRKEHAEQIRKSRRRWYLKHAEEEKLKTQQWNKENPFEAKLARMVTKANRKYKIGKLTVEDVRKIVEKANFSCYWCKKEKLKGRNMTLEHLKPINDKQFLTIACLSCNSKQLSRKETK